ncbi:MAG: hypothetical protein EOL95_09745 [Bacteroidia bacterium]|nr:hypothetical protein [Bacteroidia bacterium]
MAQIKGKWIENNTITEVKLNINSTPTDGYVLGYNSGVSALDYYNPNSFDTHDVKVSANDTTPGFLSGKLLGTSGKITLTENNDGANETLTINVGSDIFDVTTDTTTDIVEGTNLYYLDSRARAAISSNSSPRLTYNSTTGVINLDLTQDFNFTGALQNDGSNVITAADVGVANGVAGLDASGKVPTTQLPDTVLGGLQYKGVLDASAGVYPSSPETGDYYIISVAGTISGTVYNIGDWAVYNGTSWDKVDNTDLVQSVFGRTGAITAQAGDYTASQVTNAFDKTSDTTDNVLEGSSNLYFTTARVDAHLSGGTGITYSTGTISVDLTDNFNFTGTLQHNGEDVLTASSVAIETKDVEIITLNSTNITNKFVDLTNVPVDATAVQVTPVGGPEQAYTTDFTVISDGSSVKRLNWSGLGLDGVLEDNDKLIVSYTY